jgi:hypothetical protein
MAFTEEQSMACKKLPNKHKKSAGKERYFLG